MRFRESVRRKGDIKICVFRKNIPYKFFHFPNLIVNADFNMLRDFLDGTITDGEIKYLAWGSDGTGAAATDTKLGAEFGRKAVTEKAPGATGVLVTTTYIAPYEANVPDIEELGWFAGASASAVADTGILIARVVWHYAKTDLESINVVRTDTIS